MKLLNQLGLSAHFTPYSPSTYKYLSSQSSQRLTLIQRVREREGGEEREVEIWCEFDFDTRGDTGNPAIIQYGEICFFPLSLFKAQEMRDYGEIFRD